jgi:hypothetical protein
MSFLNHQLSFTHFPLLIKTKHKFSPSMLLLCAFINWFAQHEVSMFLPHQTIWQRVSSIMKAPPEVTQFPFEIFLPLCLVLPIASIFQPLAAFVCFVTFLFCYVMQIIATREENQRGLALNSVSLPLKSNFRSDQFADPIGLRSFA